MIRSNGAGVCADLHNDITVLTADGGRGRTKWRATLREASTHPCYEPDPHWNHAQWKHIPAPCAGILKINHCSYVSATTKRFFRCCAAKLVQLCSCSSLSQSEDILKPQNRSRCYIVLHSLLPRGRKMQMV